MENTSKRYRHKYQSGNLHFVSFIESKSCTPNPCKHNGQCIVVKKNFECDCTGTFYHGKTCERGTLIVPVIPILVVNQTKSNLVIQGYPDSQIVITLTSPEDLLIEPLVIKLTNNKTSAVLSVTGKQYGFFKIKYEVSGENAADFDTPQSTLVFVDKANETLNATICYQCGGVLEKGCFTKNVTSKVFVSNLQWSATKATTGITQILAYGNKALPLSLTGGQILSAGTTEMYSGRNIIEADNASRFSSNCSKESETLLDIGNILRTHAFEYSIQVFFNTYSPNWFKLIAALKTSEYYAKDLVSELYLGSELKRKSGECTAAFRFKSNNTYYIHETNQIYNILLPNSYIELPSFSTKCIIIDLKDNHIYFGFSHNKYINTRTIEVYKDIVNRFSNDISFLIGFQVISSKISFELVGSSHKVNVIGKQNYSLNFTNVNATVATEGKLSFIYDENLKYYSEMTLAEKSFVDLSFTFLVDGRTQFIQMKGSSSMINTYKKTKSNTIAKLKAALFPVTYIFQTESLTKTFTMSNLSPLTVTINYARLPLIMPSDNIKNKLLNEVNKTKDIIKETINFFKSLSVPEYLEPSLDVLKNSTRKLSSLLLSYPENNDSLFSQIELIRLLFSEELKKFSVFLDQYIQTDILDSVGMELKFINFMNGYNKFIKNTHVKNRQQYTVGELSYAVIGSKGQLCIDYFCFKNLSLTLDIMLQKVTGQFAKQGNIGNYVTIAPFSKIDSNLTDGFKSARLKGKAIVFNQVKEIDISIKQSLLSFDVDAGIGNAGSIPLLVEASLEAVIRDDPLYFVFSGNMGKSTKLNSDIEEGLKNHFTKLEETLNSREKSLKSSNSSTELLLNEVNNATELARAKYDFFKTEFKRLNDNLTVTERLINSGKMNYQKAIIQNANVTAAQLQILMEQCQPKLCNSSCIPGYKKEVCHKQRLIHLIDQKCSLQNISTIIYRYTQVNKTVPITKFEVKHYCWTECSPLKELLGKRKRRGILSKVLWNEVTEKVFEQLGGKEAALGAEIGGLLFGPVGGIVGGFIGSLFGSCDRYCAYDHVPVPGYVILQQYEKQPVAQQIRKSKCESNIRYVNGSTESVYECESKTNCGKLQMDEDCIIKQRECSQFRDSITISLEDRSNIEKLFQELTKASYIYDLLIIKRSILLQQLQSAEQDLKIARAINISAYKSYVSTENSLKKFQEATKNHKLMIAKYKKQPTLFRLDGLKLNFTYSSGMTFPEKFLTEIQVFGLTSTALFDVNNYQKSVQDILLEMKDLVEETLLEKRKRRSITKTQPNQMDKKCLSIQQAEIFFLEVLRRFREKLNDFVNMEIFRKEHNEVNEKSLEKLKQNFSSQFIRTMDDSTKVLLRNELEEVFLYKLKIEKGLSQTNAWNSTLIEAILELHLFVKDMQQNDCINLFDCLLFYTESIKNTMQFEENNVSLNISGKAETWKSNILQLITDYPNLNSSRQLIIGTYISLVEVNLRQWFCGTPPTLKTLLQGKTDIKEGEYLYLTIEVLEQKHNYSIIWKHNNFVLLNYNATALRKKINFIDQGYYSCEITNKFGTSHCGSIFVKVFRNIEFSREPQDIVGYLKSPKKTYLDCAIKNNTLDDGTFTWFFRRFYGPREEKEVLPMSAPNIEIKQDTVRRSGYYSCLYINKLVSATSREAIVHILRTTVAVEGIRITMLLLKPNQTRNRRQVNDDISDIKSELSKLLQTKPSQIKINDYSTEDGKSNRIMFTLSGSNLTSNLLNNQWDNLSEKIIKERENLLLRSVLLYYHANITTNFDINGKTYTIDGNSIVTENLEPSCPYGQSLGTNGFICGK